MNIYNFLILLVSMICMVLGSETSNGGGSKGAATRVKRGHGGGGGHGHGPGRGGGAAGPVYFCGYVGKTEGYGGYGK
ncbi:glycine-rich cell wall structural protein isoform X3 [Folsomia candida]|uniref:glycine-rich cell wall structural protein isoform X3 n=1 Tax=Folsomia candida TaxID=158441 RepID=UPI000B8F0490|nr:glycine-rich cell wall structural protein isoform X3 [Folsomia candida]